MSFKITYTSILYFIIPPVVIGGIVFVANSIMNCFNDKTVVPAGTKGLPYIYEAVKTSRVLDAKTITRDIRGSYTVNFTEGKINGHSGIVIYNGSDSNPNAMQQMNMEILGTNNFFVKGARYAEEIHYETLGQLKDAIKIAVSQITE
jgi:hypothetical protein